MRARTLAVLAIVGPRARIVRMLAVLAVLGALGALPGTARATAPPHLGVTAAALIEESTGQQLYGVNATRRVAIASTTKLMTALLTLEHVHRLSRIFTQNGYYPASVDSQIGLVPGERMSVHDLLLAMLLPSADDAAEDLAYNLGRGSVPYFVAMMNVRARELGLSHTHYSTPIGLDTPGNYSSAWNLVELTRYLLRTSPFFARAVAAPSAVLRTGDHVRVVANRNDLVGRVRWINGVKTGHTLDAGYVLVGSGTRGGMTLISVVLGTASEAERDSNTLALLDYGFANFRLREPVVRGKVLARLPVRDQSGMHADVLAADTFTRVFPRGTRLRVRLELPGDLAGPLRRHAVVGKAVVLADGRPVGRVQLLTARAVPAPPVTLSFGGLSGPFTLLWLVLPVGALVGLLLFRRERTRGRRAEPA